MLVFQGVTEYVIEAGHVDTAGSRSVRSSLAVTRRQGTWETLPDAKLCLLQASDLESPGERPMVAFGNESFQEQVLRG